MTKRLLGSFWLVIVGHLKLDIVILPGALVSKPPEGRRTRRVGPGDRRITVSFRLLVRTVLDPSVSPISSSTSYLPRLVVLVQVLLSGVFVNTFRRYLSIASWGG